MARKRPGTKGAKINKANKTLNHALQNIGSMGRFVEFVAYKVERLGKRVIQIDEAYTTQICAKCGHQAKRGLSERIIVCGNCGHQADRDLLAALNILACFYLQKDRFGDLLYEPFVNEELFFATWKGFLRHTAQGKTKVSLTSYWLRFGGLAGSSVPV